MKALPRNDHLNLWLALPWSILMHIGKHQTFRKKKNKKKKKHSYLVLLCSSIFSVLLALRLPCLGKRELILVFFFFFFFFFMFIRFALVRYCLFPLPLGGGEEGRAAGVGLRFVTVALSGLFSYLIFMTSLVFAGGTPSKSLLYLRLKGVIRTKIYILSCWC